MGQNLKTGGYQRIQQSTLRLASADRGDNDGGDVRSGSVEIGIAFGQDVDRGKVVFAEQIGQPTETPTQNHHVGGGQPE